MYGWYYRGWWCPRHAWPPAWARPYYGYYPPAYSEKEELRILEEMKRELERELREISKRIEELQKSTK